MPLSAALTPTPLPVAAGRIPGTPAVSCDNPFVQTKPPGGGLLPPGGVTDPPSGARPYETVATAGAVVPISIRRGLAASASGRVSSSMPFS